MSRRPVRATLGESPVEVPLRGGTALVEGGLGVEDEAAGEARRVLADAQMQRDEILAAAREEGIARGRAELAVSLAALVEAIEGIADVPGLVEDQLVESATALACEIAAKVVRAEIETRPELIAGIVRKAIRKASKRERLVIRVHPDDLDACRQAAPDIVERMGGIDTIRVVDEPRVTRGGCIIETPAGDVDAMLETQLGRIATALASPPDDELVD